MKFSNFRKVRRLEGEYGCYFGIRVALEISISRYFLRIGSLCKNKVWKNIDAKSR